MLERIKSFFGFGGSYSGTFGSSQRGLALQGNWLPVISSSGQAVTAQNLITQSTVYQAVYVLASGVGNVDFNVVKYLPKGGKSVLYNHPYYDLFAYEPNEDISARDMFETIMVHVCIYGNAYIQIVRDGFLNVSAFYILDPTQVQPFRDQDENGKLYYLVGGQRYASADIVHVHTLAMDGLVGLSPVAHLRELVGVAMALDSFNGAFFRNGGNLSGVLEVADELSEPAQNRLRSDVDKIHAGAMNAFKLLILEQGSKYSPISVKPNESQAVETQRMIQLRIAQAFNLPPTKLSIYDNTALNTLEESNLDFFNSSILPWVERITNAFNRKLFTRDERQKLGIEHDDRSSLESRKQDQVNVLKTLKDMGVLNTNEVREELGYGPIPDGDVYMYQSNNFTPLEGTSALKPEAAITANETSTGDV